MGFGPRQGQGIFVLQIIHNISETPSASCSTSTGGRSGRRTKLTAHLHAAVRLSRYGVCRSTVPLCSALYSKFHEHFCIPQNVYYTLTNVFITSTTCEIKSVRFSMWCVFNKIEKNIFCKT